MTANITRFVKNADSVAHTWGGIQIDPGAYYQIQPFEWISWATSDVFLASLAAGEAKMAYDASGLTDINTLSDAINFLKGFDGSPKDSDLSPIVRTKSTRTGWHYEPRFLTFITSKYQSLFNKKHDGTTDFGDAVLKFWNSAGDEMLRSSYATDALFQAALDVSCVKTTLDWQSTYDFDIRGGLFLNGVRPASKAWGWAVVAPDIPAELGGSVPHLTGGIPLHLLANYGMISFEGVTVKSVATDPVYNSNKFRTIIMHEEGVKLELGVCFQQYKA